MGNGRLRSRWSKSRGARSELGVGLERAQEQALEGAGLVEVELGELGGGGALFELLDRELVDGRALVERRSRVRARRGLLVILHDLLILHALRGRDRQLHRGSEEADSHLSLAASKTCGDSDLN